MVFIIIIPSIIYFIYIFKRNKRRAIQIQKHLDYSKQLADTAIELQDASYFDYANDELKKAEDIIYSRQQKR